MVNGEGPFGAPILSELENLPAICRVCHRLIADFDDETCVNCVVEDGPDLELVYEEYG